MSLPQPPGTAPVPAIPSPTSDTGLGGQSISLQAALYGALTSNPDLNALRLGTATTPSPESVEVARHFPTTLNPTLWFDYRPLTLIPRGESGIGGQTTGQGNAANLGNHGYYKNGQQLFYLSYRQPIELGHQTTHRYHMAQAALSHQQWTIVQAELTTLVQTYRTFQTAAYRREKLRVAQQLAEFNDRLLETLQRRLEAAQALPADVALARVESRAVRQQIKVARQDYLTALADLRNLIGRPEAAGEAEPLGEFTLPPSIPRADEAALVQMALQSRPDIHAAQAQFAGTASAVRLAQADRLTTPVLGPVYEIDEAGVQYFGLVWIQPLPILNNGKPLVRQRQAEHQRAAVAVQQAQQRAVAQVRAAVAKWNGATDLMNESASLTNELTEDVAALHRLFEAGQADLTKLMQARQRLIQLQNARLDAIWAATQAQSDLLLALGVPRLLTQAIQKEEADTGAPPDPTQTPSPYLPR